MISSKAVQTQISSQGMKKTQTLQHHSKTEHHLFLQVTQSEEESTTRRHLISRAGESKANVHPAENGFSWINIQMNHLINFCSEHSISQAKNSSQQLDSSKKERQHMITITCALTHSKFSEFFLTIKILSNIYGSLIYHF